MIRPLRTAARLARRASPLALLGLSALGLSACVVAPPPGPGPGPIAVAAPAPPAPIVETIPIAPTPLAVWRPGHWRWTGFRWVWIRGHYAVRAG